MPPTAQYGEEKKKPDDLIKLSRSRAQARYRLIMKMNGKNAMPFSELYRMLRNSSSFRFISVFFFQSFVGRLLACG